MESEGILTALAEVGIAIAGFSGIVVALQHRSVDWSEKDKLRFSALLLISLASVFWSLIPILLHLVNPAKAFVWAWSSGLWLAYMLIVAVYLILRGLRASTADPEPFAKFGVAYLITQVTLQVFLQTMNLVWLREPWPHVLTVLLGLLLASVLFIRLLRGVIGRSA
jgi:MFS family permease